MALSSAESEEGVRGEPVLVLETAAVIKDLVP